MKNKLIILNFIRKKSFVLYLILLVILYSSLLTLNVLLSNLQENKRNNYFNNSLATIHQSIDIYDNLRNNKMLGDVKRAIYFENVVLLPDIYECLREVRVDNNILFIEDSNLIDSQIELYLNEYNYEEIKKQLLYNDTLDFIVNGKSYKFIINEIHYSKYINHIAVSSNIFNELMYLNDGYDYIFKIYCSEEEVKREFSNLKMLMGTTEDEVLIANRINKHIKILGIFNIIIGIVFIIVIFIIANNINHDLQKNVILENLLGFNIKEISKNIIIRLSILNVLSLILAILTSIIVLLFINLFYIINICAFNYYIIILILIIVVVSIYYTAKMSTKKIR